MKKLKQYVVRVHDEFACDNPTIKFIETFYNELGTNSYREVLGGSPSFHEVRERSFVLDAYRGLGIVEIGTMERHGFTIFEKE